MSASATARFVRDANLLRCVGDHIRNKRQLRTLCLVGRQFSRVFTPILYAEMDLVTGEAGHNRDVLEALPDNPHIHHVRRLQCDLSHAGPVNWVVRALVRRMPLLEEFEWDGGTIHQETLMSILLSCPRLRAFVMIYEPDRELRPTPDPEPPRRKDNIYYEDNYGTEDEADAENIGAALACARTHYLVPFTSLTKLTVAEMDGPKARFETDWKEDILTTLLASPDLEELTLGFSKQCVKELVHDFVDVLAYFLQSLCEEYEAKGGQPPSLKVLRLGLGILLIPSQDNPTWSSNTRPLEAHYLSKLTRLNQLEEVYLDNRGRFNSYGRFWPDGRDEDDPRIAWDTFSNYNTPKLRRLGLAREMKVESLGEFLAPLVEAPVNEAIQKNEICRRPGLSHLALKLWDTRVYKKHQNWDDDDDDDIFSILARGMTYEPGASALDGQEAIWRKYLGLAANSSRLLVYTRAASSTEGMENLGRLEAALHVLPGIRELVLTCPLQANGWLHKFRHPKIVELFSEDTPQEKLLHTFRSWRWRKGVALSLAQAGRGIQVVKIGTRAWRVLRGGGEDGFGVTRLLSMDRYEQRRRGYDRGPGTPFPEFSASRIHSTFGEANLFDAKMW